MGTMDRRRKVRTATGNKRPKLQKKRKLFCSLILSSFKKKKSWSWKATRKTKDKDISDYFDLLQTLREVNVLRKSF